MPQVIAAAWQRGARVCCPSQKSLINPGRFIRQQLQPFDDDELEATRNTMDRMHAHLRTLDPAALALAGLPPLNGFWSKELVLETALVGGPRWAYFGLLAGAGITLKRFDGRQGAISNT